MTRHQALPNFGTQQSPIDLDSSAAFETSDGKGAITWTNLTLSYNKGRKLNVIGSDGHFEMDGEEYIPVDLHWHFPSEHTLNGGEPDPAEVHIVHVHKDDVGMAVKGQLDWLRIAVLGIFVKEDNGGEAYAPFEAEQALDPSTGSSETVDLSIDDVLPKKRSAMRYCGSLTTPPYSENVTFFIFTEARSAKSEQFNHGGNFNARPLQESNRRCILHCNVPSKGVS